MITKFHHYFMLPWSPWPLLASVSSFNFLFSALVFMKFSESVIIFQNLLNISLCSFLWWLNYSGELNLEGSNSLTLENGIKAAMIFFISSEVFFFFSFFWSYFHYYLAPSVEAGFIWPPYSIEMFDCLNVPLVNTLVLMSSGATVTLSHYYMISGSFKSSNSMLSLTIILGVTFTYLQAQEYSASFFGISDSTFGTSFFMLTGFHGVHVLIGTMFLFLVLYRFSKFTSSKMECLSFELASWYWHFVDVVWIFLYFTIYYLNN